MEIIVLKNWRSLKKSTYFFPADFQESSKKAPTRNYFYVIYYRLIVLLTKIGSYKWVQSKHIYFKQWNECHLSTPGRDGAVQWGPIVCHHQNQHEQKYTP